WSAFGALLDFRRSLAGSLAAALPEPASVLSQGLLLGLRGGLDDDLLDAFVRTGTSHILAVSGYNVAVVAGIVTLLAIMLVGRARALFLIVPSVAAYAALTGLTPSVTRAAIMGLMLAAAFHVGRQASPLG